MVKDFFFRVSCQNRKGQILSVHGSLMLLIGVSSRSTSLLRGFAVVDVDVDVVGSLGESFLGLGWLRWPL